MSVCVYIDKILCVAPSPVTATTRIIPLLGGPIKCMLYPYLSGSYSKPTPKNVFGGGKRERGAEIPPNDIQ